MEFNTSNPDIAKYAIVALKRSKHEIYINNMSLQTLKFVIYFMLTLLYRKSLNTWATHLKSF